MVITTPRQLCVRLHVNADQIHASPAHRPCGRVSRPPAAKAIRSPYFQINIDSTSSASLIDALDAYLSDTHGMNAVVVKPISARDLARVNR